MVSLGKETDKRRKRRKGRVFMKMIDCTQLIEKDMPVYPGTAAASLSVVNTHEKDGFRETLFQFTSHTGTHMDAPYHLFAERTKLEELPLSQFVGRGLVIDCTDVGAGGSIGMEHIAPVRALADAADFLLFHTGWSQYWGKAAYFGEYPVVDLAVCQYALDSGKKGLGFDTIGIDPIADPSLTRHKFLLSQKDIVIIENLTNLEKIGGDLFFFTALPLKYREADGSPVRAAAMLAE